MAKIGLSTIIKVGVVVAALIAAAFLVAYVIMEASLVNKDPSLLVLSTDDVPYYLYRSGYLSAKDAAATFLSESQLEQFGYETGYATLFHNGDNVVLGSTALRFSSVEGAHSMINATPGYGGLSEFQKLGAPNIGDESYAAMYRLRSEAAWMYNVTFRRANIVVWVDALLYGEAEMYAQILEGRI